MQINFHMAPCDRGRDCSGNAPNNDFLTEEEKLAVREIEQVGNDTLLAIVYLHDADHAHEDVWAEVEIKTYSAHSRQHSILPKMPLFNEDGSKFTREKLHIKLLNVRDKFIKELMALYTNNTTKGCSDIWLRLLNFPATPNKKREETLKMARKGAEKTLELITKLEALSSL